MICAENTVLAMGAGKATAMHAAVYADLGWQVTAYDNNPSRLTTMQSDFAQQVGVSNVTTLSSLRDLKQPPQIIDIATSSGSHTKAFGDALLASKQAPQAVLMEKPLDHFAALKDILNSSAVDERSIFVNENYNASSAVGHLLKIIGVERDAGNEVSEVFVSFDKNRVPDVLAGRFTDQRLGAYGVEMPHQLAVAMNLANVALDESMKQVENTYGMDADGVQHSEYTYTRLQTESGRDIILAQGLGPFRMDKNGQRRPYDFMHGQADRTAWVTFEDERKAVATFAPAPHVQPYHSIVDWQDANGDWQHQVHSDNTLRRVISHVISYAITGQRPENTEGLSIASGIRYSQLLRELRDGADIVRG